MKLRPYQLDLISGARQALQQHRSVLLVAATGAGKTALTVAMMAGAAERGKRSMFCVHRDTLLTQTSRSLWEQHLQHGLIASGKTMSTRQPVQVASVQTLVKRLDRVPAPDLIVIDEAHRAAAMTYRKIIAAYPGAKIVGLTATPARTDGSGLDDIFDTMVIGPSVGDLIQQGYLSPYRIYAPAISADMTGIRKRMGEYDMTMIEDMLDRPTITGDAVGHYKRLAAGKRCVVMCATISHAKHVCEAYRGAGIPAEHIDGDTPSAEREAILKRLETGETLILTSVELLIEGVDVPSIEVVQWLRPTASLIIWMQANGRGFRRADGKSELLILDHVGNSARHGLPDDPREWSLAGCKQTGRKQSDPDEVKIRQCDQCAGVYRAGLASCPYCQAPAPMLARKELEIIEDELREVDLALARQQKKREQGAARTLQDLVELGKRRGMSKPAEWGAITFAARQGRKPKPMEFMEARKYL